MVTFGIPQISIYITADLNLILSSFGAIARQYANDTPAYVHGLAADVISLTLYSHIVFDKSDLLYTWTSGQKILDSGGSAINQMLVLPTYLFKSR